MYRTSKTASDENTSTDTHGPESLVQMNQGGVCKLLGLKVRNDIERQFYNRLSLTSQPSEIAT